MVSSRVLADVEHSCTAQVPNETQIVRFVRNSARARSLVEQSGFATMYQSTFPYAETQYHSVVIVAAR